jgi:hypothetical protein
LQASIFDHDRRVAGRHAREAEVTTILGIGHDRRALDADFGVAHILAGGGVEHAAANDARSDRLGRVRRALGGRPQRDDLSVVGSNLQGRSGDQPAKRRANVHLAFDRGRHDAFEITRRGHDLHLALAGQFGNSAHRGLGRNVEDTFLRAGRRRGRERDNGRPTGEDGVTRTHWL